MFTGEAQSVIDVAKDIAATRREAKLRTQEIAAALAMDGRGAVLLAAALELDARALERRFPRFDKLRPSSGKLPLADECREMLRAAKSFAERVPQAAQAELIALPHLAAAVALTLATDRDAKAESQARSETRILKLLAQWIEEDARPASLGTLTHRLRVLRQKLLARISGQDHAVHQFLNGLFNLEVVSAADTARRKPAGLFVFAGPPGVGKTYLAELGAASLNRPFKRFDMSSYGHSSETTALVGSPRVYKDSQPGTLTGFVQRHPTAVLLFDEIEKAHPSAIQLFLQVLDAGRLQDKYTEDEVEFRDTVVIFTTNVGRQLYDDENASGVHRANAAFHRSTVLDALRSELDPRTREPFFPSAICSRMATGCPILFNRLRVDDLARIAAAELERIGALLERQHGQRYVFGAEMALALVMREGAQTDARTIKAQAETFLEDEVFKCCQLFADDRIDLVFSAIETVTVAIDREHAGDPAQRLFWEQQKPVVLFVGDALFGRTYEQLLEQIDWRVASTADQAFDVLAKRRVDFVLLDLALQQSTAALDYTNLAAAFRDLSPQPRDATELHFDHAPLAARRYAAGQQLLSDLHARMPELPVFLYAAGSSAGGFEPSVDEELLLACVRAGGARGVMRSSLGGSDSAAIEQHRDALTADIQATALRLRREKVAADLAAKNQVLAFDTAPALAEADNQLLIRCRNFRLVRATRSADVGALVSDVERPPTRFDDVVGAQGAKEALDFIRAWLEDPMKYAAAGVEPPRGVLLAGPPGTGKTMLARALAGESDCAFLYEAATGFVTKYQGSGPEALRALFDRARRYAPSVVFIDEIDAIGGNRADVKPGFVGHGESMALNQLLVEMDGFDNKPSERPVIVIAATNRAETLDPALLRRFSRSIEVELPTRAERGLYLQRRLAAKAHHEVSAAMIERLAAQGQGLSVADYERVLAQAAIMALEHRGVIDDALLSEAFEKVTLGEAKAGTDALRTARHEAGHAIVMCATGKPPIYVTIVGRGNFGGYAAFEDKSERRSQTKRDLEDHICQLLGGREAERLCYGEHAGDSTGPSNDLERATATAEAMVHDYGMASEIGFVKVSRRQPLPPELAMRCHAAVRRIIDEQSERARSLLADRRSALDRTADALVERSRLLQHELLELLDQSAEPNAADRSP